MTTSATATITAGDPLRTKRLIISPNENARLLVTHNPPDPESRRGRVAAPVKLRRWSDTVREDTIGGRVGNPYRRLFTIPGARLFVLAGFVGRMPMAMHGIGIVLLVSAVTGSYGVAGAVSAAMAVSYAAASPVSGRFVDRYGQGQVLVPLVCANLLAVTTLITFAQLRTGTWTLFPAAAAVGLTAPSLGAFVRARWSHLVEPDVLHVAYAFESVADEVIFITGPVLVTLLATGLHPAAGIGAAAALTLTGGLTLAAQRGTQPPPQPTVTAGSAISAPGMLVLVPVFALLGSAFGAIDVSVIAFAQEHGHRSLAGVVLATFALGSMSAGLWYGTRTWRLGLERRFLTGLTLLAAGLVPLPFIHGLWLLLPMIYITGLAISPTIIPGYGLVERLVPRRLLTEGFTWLSTSVGVGVAIGSPVAGRLVDAYGASTALLYPLAACWAAVAAALAGARRLRPPLPEDERT
jgi:MFS family permease